MGVRWSKSSLHLALLAICAICIAPVMTPLTHVIPNVISECLIATEVISVNFPSTEPIYKCMDFHNYRYEILPCPCLHVNEPRFKVSLILWAEMGSWRCEYTWSPSGNLHNVRQVLQQLWHCQRKRQHRTIKATLLKGTDVCSYASYRWTH